MRATGATVLPAPWVTPCCERVPAHIGSYRYACRGCGAIYVDTAGEVRATFGAGVVAVIARRERRAVPMSMDEWEAAVAGDA